MTFNTELDIVRIMDYILNAIDGSTGFEIMFGNVTERAIYTTPEAIQNKALTVAEHTSAAKLRPGCRQIINKLITR